MQRITLIVGLMLITVVASPCLMGQSRQKHKAPANEYLEDLRARPDLGIDYARVVKFKSASRKTTYRVGEMISIDIAFMNVSSAPVFLHKLDRPSLELTAQDANGRSVSINDYYTVLEGVAPTSFERIEPG